MDVKITLPLLPLRDIVVFPSMVIPLFVGRDKSITALNEVMKGDKKRKISNENKRWNQLAIIISIIILLPVSLVVGYFLVFQKNILFGFPPKSEWISGRSHALFM